MLLGRKNRLILEKIARECQQLPETIIDTWKEDYDIISLDKTIKRSLKEKLQKLPKFETRKKELKEQLQTENRRPFQTLIQSQIDIVEKEIKNIKDLPNQYDEESKPYIDLYKKMGNVIFGRIRQRLIESYLNLARNYYPHQISRDYGTNDICPDCFQKLEKFDNFENEDNEDVLSCPKCFKEFRKTLDWSKIAISSKKKDYDVVENFEKIADQYEGKVLINLPKTLWADFDSLIDSKGWKKENLSKLKIIELLRETENSDLYPHLNKIAYLYCQIPLPDLSEYRQIIRLDYEEYSQIYPLIEKERDSALNGLFVLFKLLERRGFIGALEDFKPSISEATLKIYDKIWKKVCEKLNWVYIPTKIDK